MAASKSFSGTLSTTLVLDGSEGFTLVSMLLVSGTVTWTGTASAGVIAPTAVTLQAGTPLNIAASQPGTGVAGTITVNGGSSVAVVAF